MKIIQYFSIQIDRSKETSNLNTSRILHVLKKNVEPYSEISIAILRTKANLAYGQEMDAWWFETIGKGGIRKGFDPFSLYNSKDELTRLPPFDTSLPEFIAYKLNKDGDLDLGNYIALRPDSLPIMDNPPMASD